MKKYFFAILVLFLSLHFFLKEPNFTPQVATYSETEKIVFNQKKIASPEVKFLLYPGKDGETYTYSSDVKESDFTFSSVALSWQQLAQSGDFLHAQIQLRENGIWTPWIDLEEEHDDTHEHEDDHHDNEGSGLYAIVASNGAQAFRYRFILDSPLPTVPEIKNLNWTFLRTSNESKIASFNENSSNRVPIITRDEWGAFEFYRYLETGDELVLAERDGDFYEKHKKELQYSRVIYGDDKGQYRWPLQYPEKVEKFVVHHTATTSNLDQPINAIRDIYYYHANVRGWGDIGYNYVVDKNGTVYEGRYGGEGVIGAHAPFANHGSIGIALLGNYQTEAVPQDAIEGLSKLIQEKAQIHDIKPDGFSNFRQLTLSNILAHRDVDATACPGDFLYDKLPTIRQLASRQSIEVDKFIEPLAFNYLNQEFYTQINGIERKTFTFELENIGKETWNSDTYLLVNKDAEAEASLTFPTREGVVLARMKEQSVAPGEVATFEFALKGRNNSANLNLDFHLMYNGKTKSDEAITLSIAVIPPIFSYKIIESKVPEGQFRAGEKLAIEVKLQNLSNQSWIALGETDIRLISNQGNVIFMNEERVEPNGYATFKLSYDAPDISGNYSETFLPEIKGAVFKNIDPVRYTVQIYNRETAAHKNLIPLVNNLKLKSNEEISFRLKNTGITDWKRTDLNLQIHLKSDIDFTGFEMSPSRVSPGQIATITMKLTSNEEGKSKIFINPIHNGNVLLATPILMNINTQQSSVQAEEESMPIRIKLGFQGEPEVTSNQAFDVYEDGNYLTRVPAGDAYKASRSGIRFESKPGGVLEILNYEKRPAWNTDLNDNTFRGNLEVIEEDGVLRVVNELPLEDYLKGLGEVSNHEETEKIKAIMVAARTYAVYYMQVDEKFPGKPYHLDDDPNSSQKYLGYGLEKRSPEVSKGVEATEGMVVYYNGELVKTPYFSRSDGKFTKSAEEVWGWTNTPYLISVDDSLCDSTEFFGHGVGLSGCGATGMAKTGADYREILKHYYTGIDIVKLY